MNQRASEALFDLKSNGYQHVSFKAADRFNTRSALLNHGFIDRIEVKGWG